MFSLVRIGLGNVVVVAALALGYLPDEQQTGNSTGKEDGNAKVGSRKPDFSLTAEQFTREFLKDKTAAKKKYQGKTIEITGPVDSVSILDAGKTVNVRLEGVKEKRTDVSGVLIQASLRPEFNRIGSHLSSKQKVKLTADFETWLGFVNMTNGSLQELTRSEMVVISAPELAREFAKDAKAASAKYAQKLAIVTGEVEGVTEKAGFYFARLKADGKTGVVVTVGAKESRVLQKGKTASLRGNFGFFPRVENNELSLDGGSVVEVK